LRLAPDGSFELFARIEYGYDCEPIPNTEVRVIFSASAEEALYWCPGQEHPVITGTTNSDGEVTFNIRAGGCLDLPYAIIVEVDPGAITVDTYDRVGSPDMHSDNPPRVGDGDVDLNDFVVFSSRFLEEDYCADLHDSTPPLDERCDEFVDLDDFVVFMRSFLQGCR